MAKVKQIVRYPVKSMQGEYMEAVRIHTHGVEGDHIFAWEKKGQPGDYLTIPKYPFLLNYGVNLKSNGTLSISENENIFSSEKLEEVDSHFSDKAGLHVTLASMNIAEGQTSYWEYPLLIASTSSLEKMKELSKREQLDMLRFRPNLIIDFEKDTPFLEEQWIGEELTINDVVLKIEKGCERCSYVNVDSITKEIDANVLKTVVKENKNIFGVYASVKKTGEIRVGDSIERA
ncbi:MOSC domain-containing protein [Pseudalkalibacillus berkeleyi]|uniref:MOSC domain-containing protein n=1 Tax=Pseudalkalibacillus berkeleyi TaxID=1069813 RepID=A0ABS9H4W5_9BACL|nr:MOSC domain-containing protein [Pseudalkalibacillus berkeleyi]MCF6138989.1 MOSC domain-containing protein [Pseudalkalibacillus berkeleyi]